jgi:hypothetical protein
MKHLPEINIKTIPHSSQRYDTAGDYFERRIFWNRNEVLEVRVSEMNPDYEFMVTIHELIELYLVKQKGIKIEDIDKFDMKTVFEVDPKNQEDPGASKLAPYHKEHMFATKIEKLLCKELGVDWKTYDDSFSQLKYK